MGISSKFFALVAPSQRDVPHQLRQLARLRDAGVLTGTEIAAQTRRLSSIDEAEVCADAAAASHGGARPE